MPNETTLLLHEKLIAWQVACELLRAVRDARISDPKLRDQAMRAAQSACLNIAEANGRVSVADRRRAIPRVLLSLVIFLGLSSPLILILSRSKGRWTLGGGGELVYAWFVNGTPVFYNWQGEAPNVGVPKHPTRKLFDRPAVYEYAAPIRGTYPPWYDPAYWNAGLELP